MQKSIDSVFPKKNELKYWNNLKTKKGVRIMALIVKTHNGFSKTMNKRIVIIDHYPYGTKKEIKYKEDPLEYNLKNREYLVITADENTGAQKKHWIIFHIDFSNHYCFKHNSGMADPEPEFIKGTGTNDMGLLIRIPEDVSPICWQFEIYHDKQNEIDIYKMIENNRIKKVTGKNAPTSVAPGNVEIGDDRQGSGTP